MHTEKKQEKKKTGRKGTTNNPKSTDSTAEGFTGGFDINPGTMTQALIDLDISLMKLLAQRARLVSRLRGGKERPTTPRAIQDEKTVRLAWEKNALAFSKDPQFSRDLFLLLQDIKLLTKEEAETTESFVLAPQPVPVRANISGPVSSFSALLWLALSAGSGQAIELGPLPLTNKITSFVGTLIRCNAKITVDPFGIGLGSVVVEAGDPLSLQGQNVHADNSHLALYLFSFLAVQHTGVTRLTGDTSLQHVDLTVLRTILPLLGARFAPVMMHAKGLPATIESSGMLPEKLLVPQNLPLEGICALLLAAVVWNKKIVIDFSALPAASVSNALSQVLPLVNSCEASCLQEGACIVVSPAALQLPKIPPLFLDASLAGYTLALPAFTKGNVTLQGKWAPFESNSFDVSALLGWAGLELQHEEKFVQTYLSKKEPFTTPLHGFDMEGPLFPLYVALTVKAQGQKGGIFTLPFALEDAQLLLANEFYARVGLVCDGQTLYRDSDLQTALPWACPNAYWGMAFALLSYVRAGLKLINPREVTTTMPSFWSMYNSLPMPHDPLQPKKKKEGDNAKTSRRRIIAE